MMAHLFPRCIFFFLFTTKKKSNKISFFIWDNFRYATCRVDNIPSLKLLQNQGFEIISQGIKFNAMRYELELPMAKLK